MGDNAFKDICDRFSGTVDEAQFERFRWTRDEQPKLQALIEMVTSVFEDREDFTLAEEGGASGQTGFKRFILKVHGQRTVAIAVMFKDGLAVLGSEPVERSNYTTDRTEPVFTEFGNVDQRWVEDALGTLIADIRPVG
jgi:hypothetical protein